MSTYVQEYAVEILPAVIPHSLLEVGEKVKSIGCESGTVHVDATDGMYAGEACWIPEEETLPHIGETVYEVHLMVEGQKEIGNRFIQGGAQRIIGQLEAFDTVEEVKETLSAWKVKGVEVGLAILLDTPLSALVPFVRELDVIQIMSIPSIGAQGVALDVRVWERLQEAKSLFPGVPLSVDGGVKLEHIHTLMQLGVNRAVVGSGILKAESPKDMYQEMVRAARR